MNIFPLKKNESHFLLFRLVTVDVFTFKVFVKLIVNYFVISTIIGDNSTDPDPEPFKLVGGSGQPAGLEDSSFIKLY